MVALLSLSECATDAANLTLVGYDGVEAHITHFIELKCLLTTTPNRHIFGIWVHRLVHTLAAELMIGAFVFQVVGAGESILISNFLLGPGGASILILHIETAGETHVLVGPLLNHV